MLQKMKTKTDWADFYKDRVNSDSYKAYFVNKYKEYFNAIILVKAPYIHGIAEFGAGIGTCSIILKQLYGYRAQVGYDICPKMIELAVQNAGYDHNLMFHLWDITQKFPQLRRFDVIHSHGVLEHFSDIEIQNIFYHQTTYTDAIVHYVPTNAYEEPSFGNEKLMSPDQWREILSDWDIELKLFNENRDMLIIWQNKD